MREGSATLRNTRPCAAKREKRYEKGVDFGVIFGSSLDVFLVSFSKLVFGRFSDDYSTVSSSVDLAFSLVFVFAGKTAFFHRCAKRAER